MRLQKSRSLGLQGPWWLASAGAKDASIGRDRISSKWELGRNRGISSFSLLGPAVEELAVRGLDFHSRDRRP